MKHILNVGVHYENTPIVLREKMVFTEAYKKTALKTLKDYDAVDEVVILSTCNRTEIYITTENVTSGLTSVTHFLAYWFNLSQEDLALYLKVNSDQKAIEHLFSMTCGLDSLVVGESQILGQVKAAFDESQKLNLTYKTFNELFKRVITFAKKAHHDTGIDEQALSVSYVAVEQAKQVVSDIADAKILVLGAGETGERVIKNLSAINHPHIMIMNRSFEKGERLAQKYKIKNVPYKDLYQTLNSVDLVISATSAPKQIIQLDDVAAAVHPLKELIFIDIAMPRDIDVAINRLVNMQVFNMDDFEEIIATHKTARSEAALVIAQQIKPEIAAFENWVANQEAVPVIQALMKKSQKIQQTTWQSMERKMPDLNEHEKKVIQKHTKSIIHQLLQEPIEEAKRMSESQADLTVFEQIFGLKEHEKIRS